MAWIRMIAEADATGDLQKEYAKAIEPWGGVDNIMKIHSLNVQSLKAHAFLYITLMRGESELSKAQREMIAVVVSTVNHCVY
jgi:uncharacterized peroxidase-related enzyme